MNSLAGDTTKNPEWWQVCQLIDKIDEIEEGIDGHWSELTEMIASMVEQDGKEKNPLRIFSIMYAYCLRLYYRIKSNPVKRTFNQVSKIELSTESVYRITNYDYKVFKWAIDNGYQDTVSNDYIDIPLKKLTNKQRQSFDSRIGEENGN